jgi:hypothetical protein
MIMDIDYKRITARLANWLDRHIDGGLPYHMFDAFESAAIRKLISRTAPSAPAIEAAPRPRRLIPWR